MVARSARKLCMIGVSPPSLPCSTTLSTCHIQTAGHPINLPCSTILPTYHPATFNHLITLSFCHVHPSLSPDHPALLEPSCHPVTLPCSPILPPCHIQPGTLSPCHVKTTLSPCQDRPSLSPCHVHPSCHLVTLPRSTCHPITLPPLTIPFPSLCFLPATFSHALLLSIPSENSTVLAYAYGLWPKLRESLKPALAMILEGQLGHALHSCVSIAV
eukprot:1158565-Pelagomonas_calceolata.AAC.3